MIAKSFDLVVSEAGVQVVLSLEDNSSGTHLAMLSASDGPFDVEIKKHRKRRSLTANGYLWTLLDKMAKAIGNTTKEELYRVAVREVGIFEYVPVKEEALKRWITSWNDRGLGWFSDKFRVADEETMPGYIVTINYYGSSVYNREEFGHLLDYVISECKDAGVETLPPNEIARLKAMIGE